MVSKQKKKKKKLDIITILLTLIVVESFALLYFWLPKIEGEFLISGELKKAVDHWCGDIENEHVRELCKESVITDHCASFRSKGFCIGVDIAREVWPTINKTCSWYSTQPSDFARYLDTVCIAKAMAVIDLEAAKTRVCDRIPDNDWRLFCYGDATSKVDLEAADKECDNIPNDDIKYYCKILVANKRHDVDKVKEYCSMLRDETIKSNLKILCGFD